MLPGFHDTAAAAVPFFSRILESKAADQFGSLPSLHVTWALWVAVASQTLVRHRAVRAALWAYPALTVLDVIATANHYLLDVITVPGGLVLAYAIARLPALRRRQWHWPAPQRTPVMVTPADIERARSLLSSRRHRRARSSCQRFHPQVHLRVTPSRVPRS